MSRRTAKRPAKGPAKRPAPSKDHPGLAARRAAARLLHGVLFDQIQLGSLTGPILAKLEPADRARANTLADMVLRHLPRLDTAISAFTERRPPLFAQNALRIAAAELLLDEVPAHAAVDAAVMLVSGHPKTRHLKGLVNAVARKLDTEGRAAWPDLPPPGLPAPMKARLAKSYGKAAIPGIEAAHLAGAPFDLTAKADAATLAETLGGTLLPTGSVRLSTRPQLSALPGFEEGDWWVQDAAAAVPARVLAARAGERVLDLCAAPGGKTMQLAAAGAKVTALDIAAERLEQVAENLTRTRLEAELVEADALEWEPAEPFDAILVDAPCSATGTIRRHPDLPHLRPNPDLRPLLALQADMLDRAARWLRPGGRLVYCTCSLIVEEGERQAEACLTRHQDFSRRPIAAEQLGLAPNWLTTDGDLRLRPDYWAERGGMDGFFVTFMQKI